MGQEERYGIRLTEKQWAEVIGWLRNGNHTSSELADSIEATLKKQKGS
jgi:hypothetical protein